MDIKYSVTPLWFDVFFKFCFGSGQFEFTSLFKIEMKIELARPGLKKSSLLYVLGNWNSGQLNAIYKSKDPKYGNKNKQYYYLVLPEWKMMPSLPFSFGWVACLPYVWRLSSSAKL